LQAKGHLEHAGRGDLDRLAFFRTAGPDGCGQYHFDRLLGGQAITNHRDHIRFVSVGPGGRQLQLPVQLLCRHDLDRRIACQRFGGNALGHQLPRRVSVRQSNHDAGEAVLAGDQGRIPVTRLGF